MSGHKNKSAASAAELRKALKYSDTITGVDVIPFVIETSGAWSQQVVTQVNDVHRSTSVTQEPRSTTFLHQRILVVIQRGNACYILGTFKLVTDDNQKLDY
jgi:hypothetical protein